MQEEKFIDQNYIEASKDKQLETFARPRYHRIGPAFKGEVQY